MRPAAIAIRQSRRISSRPVRVIVHGRAYAVDGPDNRNREKIPQVVVANVISLYYYRRDARDEYAIISCLHVIRIEMRFRRFSESVSLLMSLHTRYILLCIVIGAAAFRGHCTRVLLQIIIFTRGVPGGDTSVGKIVLTRDDNVGGPGADANSWHADQRDLFCTRVRHRNVRNGRPLRFLLVRYYFRSRRRIVVRKFNTHRWMGTVVTVFSAVIRRLQWRP